MKGCFMRVFCFGGLVLNAACHQAFCDGDQIRRAIWLRTSCPRCQCASRGCCNRCTHETPAMNKKGLAVTPLTVAPPPHSPSSFPLQNFWTRNMQRPPASSASSSSLPAYVELKIAAADLRGRRVDPFAVLARPTGGSFSTHDEIVRTETVWSEANPAFVTSFEIPLNGDQIPEGEFRVVLYSRSSRSDELRRNTFLGYADFSLSRVFAKRDGVIERVLRARSGRSERKRGSVIICGEKVKPAAVKHMYSIQFGFAKRSDVWGSASRRKARRCFYVIYRAIINGVGDEDWTPVYRSEVVDPFRNVDRECMFEGASIQAEHLYGMDENRALRFELFHYNQSGTHIPLGFVQTSASAFKYAKPGGKLYMVPVSGSTLKQAFVTLDMAKMGLTTRRGGVSSVFCLKADAFVWGKPGETVQSDDYLERDSYGRTRVEAIVDREHMPRGVSYMGSRLHRLNSDYDSDEEEADDDGDDNGHLSNAS